MGADGKKCILFYRNFVQFTGGHLKVWDYFTHIQASKTYTASVYFTEKSVWNETNPWWRGGRAVVADRWTPAEADVLFLGGTDWRALPAAFRNRPPVPVINIVQGLSHTDPQDPKYPFLGHRAVRVCVNPLLEVALRRVPHLNGPLFHIPMGLDTGALPSPGEDRFDVVIAAMKTPELGTEIAARLQQPSRQITLLDRPLPRQDYLRTVAEARVAVLLPKPREGFFLPMLEAMAMRRIAVSPDCVANRAYCVPGRNGFLPAYSAPAIAEATEAALALPPTERRAMGARAAETAAAYTPERERAAFLDVLDRLDALW